jgi:HSP20 family protein
MKAYCEASGPPGDLRLAASFQQDKNKMQWRFQMAELVRWNPAREMTSLRDAMDRLFEESFLRPGWFGAPDPQAVAMPMDIYETADNIVVKAAVPGIKPEDIEVTLTGDLLTIKGENKTEEKVERENYLRQERRYGSFCRQVSLPVTVKTESVQATFENGVLNLELPKAEAVKTKTVKVVAK